VKLAELWLRERSHLEGQLVCCRRDMARGLARLGAELDRVADWAAGRREEREAAREARQGQRLVCGRLHGELAVLREYKALREAEQRRAESREERWREERERARAEGERERREQERGTILAWRRNRIEVANLSRLQLEEELREVLRERRAREETNSVRIKFREVQHSQRRAEAGEHLREREVEAAEREARLEGLRR
jgi:hypothetical protein